MTRYFEKSEDHTITLSAMPTIAQAPAEMTQFRAYQGAVEVTTKSRQLPAQEVSQQIKQLVKRGFLEVDGQRYAELMARAAQTLGDRFREHDAPGYRVSDWPGVCKTVDTQFRNEPSTTLAERLRKFRIYDAPVVSAGTLSIHFDSLSPEVQTGSRNLVYRQGLTLAGNLDAGAMLTTVPQFLHIEGDLHVHHLILTGWMDMVVTGSVFASGVVLACMGESGGCLQVGGDLHAQSLLGGDMFDMVVKGRVDTPVHWLADAEMPFATATVVPSEITHTDWPDRAKLSSVSDAAYMEATDWSSPEKPLLYSFAVEKAVATLRAGQALFRT